MRILAAMGELKLCAHITSQLPQATNIVKAIDALKKEQPDFWECT
jgi:hypothetical protein